jgi:hypothetical protein
VHCARCQRKPALINDSRRLAQPAAVVEQHIESDRGGGESIKTVKTVKIVTEVRKSGSPGVRRTGSRRRLPPDGRALARCRIRRFGVRPALPGVGVDQADPGGQQIGSSGPPPHAS